MLDEVFAVATLLFVILTPFDVLLFGRSAKK